MSTVCTLVKSNMTRGGFLAKDANMETFATCAKILRTEDDAHRGMYRICFTKGILQGHTTYAENFEHLNDKCSVIAREYFN